LSHVVFNQPEIASYFQTILLDKNPSILTQKSFFQKPGRNFPTQKTPQREQQMRIYQTAKKPV